MPVSTVHTILRNRLYTGWFEWNGKLIQGKHEALVPVELWERVQSVLDGRFAKKAKRGKHDFAFSGLIACHACGCAVAGEICATASVNVSRNAEKFTMAPICLGCDFMLSCPLRRGGKSATIPNTRYASASS